MEIWIGIIKLECLYNYIDLMFVFELVLRIVFGKGLKIIGGF